jgi:xylulokinase
VYASPAEAFGGLERILTVEPTTSLREQYQAAYGRWQNALSHLVPNLNANPFYV